MSFKRLFFVLCLIATLGVVAAGCGDDDDDSSESSEETTEVSAEDCTPDQLETVAADTLTIATDDPAFPPYFEDNDPTNGEGFESAVAYAVAEELGFTEDQVEWVVEPFNRSYAPGPKDYDFDINQISITAKRAEAVDFSSPYYEAKQAVVALKDSPIADATSLADVADADIGAQIGTTSLDAIETVIQPSSTRTGVRHVERRRLGAQERAGGGRRRRRADRLLPDRGAGDRRQDRRPVRGARGRRVRPSPREGLAPHAVRERRRSTR